AGHHCVRQGGRPGQLIVQHPADRECTHGRIEGRVLCSELTFVRQVGQRPIEGTTTRFTTSDGAGGPSAPAPHGPSGPSRIPRPRPNGPAGHIGSSPGPTSRVRPRRHVGVHEPGRGYHGV